MSNVILVYETNDPIPIIIKTRREFGELITIAFTKRNNRLFVLRKMICTRPGRFDIDTMNRQHERAINSIQNTTVT
jgi:hypothetical protein